MGEIENNSKGWYLLRQMLPDNLAQHCKGLVICKTGKACIFDVPDDYVPRAKEARLWKGMTLSVPKILPEVQERDCDLGAASQQLKERRQQFWDRRRAEKDSER